MGLFRLRVYSNAQRMQRSQPLRVYTADLRGDFVGRVLLQEAADAAVQVFGVLADDDEVDVLRSLAGQRGFDAGEQLHRAQIDVLIELEPQLQQQAFFEDAGRHVGMADRAEEHGVELSQFVGAALGSVSPVRR